MSCVPIPDDQRHVLETVAVAVTVPAGDLPSKVVEALEDAGWLFEFDGQVALKGAGTWHTSADRSSAGMLEQR